MSKDRAVHARHSVREIRRARADRTVADLAPVIGELRASGVISLWGIATGLNERGRGRVRSLVSHASGRLLARLPG
jgi:hypothetical protein